MIEYRPGRLKLWNWRGSALLRVPGEQRLWQCTASSEAFHCTKPWLAFSIQMPCHTQLAGHSTSIIGRLQPFSLHLPCCLSFWSVISSYHISHWSYTTSLHNLRKYHCHLCCRLLLSLVIHASLLVFWPPPLPILISIHLPIYRTKLARMAAFLHSFKSWYFLKAMPCTFSMLNTHSPCLNAFRMVIFYLNPPGCTAG
jgi:hypothetical protein